MPANGRRRNFKLGLAEMEDRHHLIFDTYEEGKLTLEEYLGRVVFCQKRPFTRAQLAPERCPSQVERCPRRTCERGLAYRKSGNPVPTSAVHKILRKRAYTGDYDYNGVTYHGCYEPIVTMELWERWFRTFSMAATRSGRKSGSMSSGSAI